ncbi:MAG: iron complex transport system substrate-binding protein [Bradymonadia bacterium]
MIRTLTVLLGVLVPLIAQADAPQRIISLGGGVTATVYALGKADAVIAIDTSSAPPVGRAVPRVGYVRTVAPEGLLALKPDLVVAPESFGPPTARTQLKAAGVRLEILPEVKSIDGAIARMQRLGEIFDAAPKAAALIADLKAADAATPPKPNGPRVLFLFVHGNGPLQAAGTGTRAAAVIDAAGGRNAMTAFAGYRPLSPEAAVGAKPDVFLTTTRALQAVGGQAGFWRTPGLSLTPAGQKKRLIVFDDLALLGFGPALAATLRELHARL